MDIINSEQQYELDINTLERRILAIDKYLYGTRNPFDNKLLTNDDNIFSRSHDIKIKLDSLEQQSPALHSLSPSLKICNELLVRPVLCDLIGLGKKELGKMLSSCEEKCSILLTQR